MCVVCLLLCVFFFLCVCVCVVVVGGFFFFFFFLGGGGCFWSLSLCFSLLLNVCLFVRYFETGIFAAGSHILKSCPIQRQSFLNFCVL